MLDVQQFTAVLKSITWRINLVFLFFFTSNYEAWKRNWTLNIHVVSHRTNAHNSAELWLTTLFTTDVHANQFQTIRSDRNASHQCVTQHTQHTHHTPTEHEHTIRIFFVNRPSNKQTNSPAYNVRQPIRESGKILCVSGNQLKPAICTNKLHTLHTRYSSIAHFPFGCIICARHRRAGLWF